MLGLFGTLGLATRSLQTQQQGTEVAGHNLANVNNPAYSRQRLSISTSLTLPSPIGPEGTGADAVGITQLRSALLDRQVQSESSIRASLEASQSGLQFAQAGLGEEIDRQADGPAGVGTVAGQSGLAANISDLFNSFQSLSTNPTSTAERQVLVIKAQNLSTQFNQVSSRLSNLHDSLNDSLKTDVGSANDLMTAIAKLNEQVGKAEINNAGVANDLRDIREQKLEELAKLVKFDGTEDATGAVNISIAGTSIVSGSAVMDKLETYDPGSGNLMVRTVTGATPLTLTAGSMAGTISVRDGEVAALRSDLDTLAGNLISRVNTIHSAGYSLTGSTGENFFTGTTAGTIGVNSTISNNPTLIQASGVSGAAGDNQVMLALAQLADTKIPALGNQTFAQNYGQTVAKLGQSLASVNTQISNQDIVEKMLTRQRDSISGVSVDEEMTDLMKYQKAFEASAKLINTIDRMFDVVLSLKQ
jgi:flagellar hook-associated protein 1 FlgK